MALITKSGKKLFSNIKQNHLLITKDILKKITDNKALSVIDLNVNIVFKKAWAGFIKIKELTYTMAEAKKATFAETSLIRSDISFRKGDQYTILHLK